MGERGVAGETLRGHGVARWRHRSRSLLVALVLGVAMLVALPADALARDHHLAFMSDYHDSGDTLVTALSQMPDDTEYVSLIGDLVGDRGDMTPTYQSSWILGLVQQALPALTARDVSIVWASHDANVIDDAGIVKCLGGNTSEQIYVGTEPDGTMSYCIYAIGFNDMCAGGEQSVRAAAAFKTWVASIDPCVPVIVVCHVPLHAARTDNRGATYWSEALNYAATGTEGLNGTGTSATIVRNVFFLHGHNHTIDEREYLYLPASTMKVAADVESEGFGPRPPSGEDGERPKPPSGDEGNKGRPDGEGPGGKRPNLKAEGVDATIYYTSLTAGYLKISDQATLVTVADDDVTLAKYGPQGVTSLGINVQDGLSAATSVSFEAFTRSLRSVDATVRVTSEGAVGIPAPGATIGVRPRAA